VWLVIERTAHHFVIDATEETSGRRVRLVLSLRASATVATALHALAKITPGEDPGVLDFATKGTIEVA